MRTLLIADDERTIREGIANAINWKNVGVSRVLLASDGMEAVKMIENEQPDIAIVDIIMPELTGMEVISHFRDVREKPEFVVLSGYGEFDYAQQAIRNNVRSYLLKPCDTKEISDTIRTIIQNLEEKSASEEERLLLEDNLKQLMPQAKEKLLRDFLTGRMKKQSDLDLFCRLFDHGCKQLQMVLFCSEPSEHGFGLEEIRAAVDSASALFGWYFSMIAGDCVVLVFDVEKCDPIKAVINQIGAKVCERGVKKVCAVLSSRGELRSMKEIYREALQIIRQPLHHSQRENRTVTIIDAADYHQSSVVQKVILYVKENVGNRNITLSYIATNVLYMNADYLGRLFKKECGMKFSEYLMLTRLEMARELLGTIDDIRIYELAYRLGFGDDTAYFSKMFQRHTGFLPSEYRLKS